MKELEEEFERVTPYSAWINADIYPDGRIHTREFTEWLAKRMEKLERKAWECSVEMMEIHREHLDTAENPLKGNNRSERESGISYGWKMAAYKVRDAFGFPKSETPEKFK